MARPREAVGCRTLICRKVDSGQLNDLATTRPSGQSDSSGSPICRLRNRWTFVLPSKAKGRTAECEAEHRAVGSGISVG